MTNRYLSRDDAPIEDKTWEILDSTVLQAAKSVLTGRRMLHVDGPHGLGVKAVALGDPEEGPEPISSRVLPLVLISRSFALGKRDLAAFERDGMLFDTRPVIAAAVECAELEDNLIFRGIEDAEGLLTGEGSQRVQLAPWTETGAAAEAIIKALTTLDGAGFHGPYFLALSPDRYNLLLRRYPTGNFSELEHIRSMGMEGVFKAPALESGGILMASGRHVASIVLGQDLTVGFIGPVGQRLEFSVSESLVPFILQPEGVCLLEDQGL